MEVVQAKRSIKIYIASDGTEFTTEQRCLSYEASKAYVDSIIKDTSVCGSSYKIIKVESEEQWTHVCRYFVNEFDNEDFYDFESEHKDYIGKYLVVEYKDELTSIKLVEDWLKDKQAEIDWLIEKMNLVSKYKNE